jgi:hypothetical protein
MLTRRDFIHTGCTIGVATLLPAAASASSDLNDSRVTINVQMGYMNLAKTFFFNIDPTNASSDGYPLSTPSNSWGCNPSMPPGYYGDLVWKFSGQGSMQILGQSVLISSASARTTIYELVGATSGAVSGNITISGQTNPRIVFRFGWKIQSIVRGASNGQGGNLIRVTVPKNNFDWGGYTGALVNITEANPNTGANGTWTVTRIDAQTFDLQDSNYSTEQASAAGKAVYAAQNLAVFLPTSGRYSNMSDLVICRETDEIAIANGAIVDTTLISQLKYLMNSASRGNPGWLRFMDLTAVQGSYESDFSQRLSPSYLCYAPTRYVPSYWVNSITNGGDDAYACSNPPYSTSQGWTEGYVDGEFVQGKLSATNTGGNPTLNVNGRGPVPIYPPQMYPFIFRFSAAPASVGITMQWVFSAAWLNGGSPYTFSYTTEPRDVGNLGYLNFHLQTAVNADSVLSAGRIQANNSAQLVLYPPTAAVGRLTITYSSGPAICTIIKMDPSTLTSGGNVTFIYNHLLGGFVYNAGGVVQSIPLEAIVELCNRVGAHCWFTWGITKGSWVTAVTGYFAKKLNPGLKFGTEVGNELWNFGLNPYVQYLTLGTALGFDLSNGDSFSSYGGLRTLQYANLSRAAWSSAGRPASDHYILQMGATFEYTPKNTLNLRQFAGASFDANANPIYGAHGGLNGSGPEPSHNLPGQRPIDITTAIGCAPYWGSPWWGGDASVIKGTVAQNAPALRASLDFANGNAATAFASLVNQFNGTIGRSDGIAHDAGLVLGSANTNEYYYRVFSGFESIAASYDSYRAGAGLPRLGIMHYEGGPHWGMGQNSVNGVNGVYAQDIKALATQFEKLGWAGGAGVGAYTKSGTNSMTELATQVITMAQAWKYDASYKNLIKTEYYGMLQSISGGNREVHPAQYGYAASQWALFPVSYSLGNQYTNYDAIHEWNA